MTAMGLVAAELLEQWMNATVEEASGAVEVGDDWFALGGRNWADKSGWPRFGSSYASRLREFLKRWVMNRKDTKRSMIGPSSADIL